MSVALYCTLRQGGGVNQNPNARFRGRLELRSFFPEDCVHNIAVRIVEGLPFGFIFGATILLREQEHPELGTDKGFNQPQPHLGCHS